MADRTRIRIAALVTALFIGGLSVAGMGLRHQTVAQPAATAQASPAAAELPPAYDDEGGYESDDD